MFEDVGRNLRRLRRERDLTQGQVARFARVRQQDVSAIERGLRPPSALVDRLARALGVDANELLRDRVDVGRAMASGQASPPQLLARDRQATEQL